MRESAITAPFRHPLFRRLATTYALNEMGDWMGIVALSVLVYDATDSPLATAGLFLGTRFLPAFLAPLLVTRIEKPPPALRAAARLLRRDGGLRGAGSAGLALLAADRDCDRHDRRHPRGGEPRADPIGRRQPARAGRGTAGGERRAERLLHRGRGARPGTGGARRRRVRPADGALPERRLLLSGRLDPPYRRADPARRARRGRNSRPTSRRRPLSPRERDPAPAADRPGPRLRLLLRGDPDRGRSTPRRPSAPTTPGTA